MHSIINTSELIWLKNIICLICVNLCSFPFTSSILLKKCVTWITLIYTPSGIDFLYIHKVAVIFVFCFCSFSSLQIVNLLMIYEFCFLSFGRWLPWTNFWANFCFIWNVLGSIHWSCTLWDEKNSNFDSNLFKWS